jgi:hypothetical protein
MGQLLVLRDRHAYPCIITIIIIIKCGNQLGLLMCGKDQGTFREHAGKNQGTCREHPGNIQVELSGRP